jgi:hypothetical protein
MNGERSWCESGEIRFISLDGLSRPLCLKKASDTQTEREGTTASCPFLAYLGEAVTKRATGGDNTAGHDESCDEQKKNTQKESEVSQVRVRAVGRKSMHGEQKKKHTHTRREPLETRCVSITHTRKIRPRR